MFTSNFKKAIYVEVGPRSAHTRESYSISPTRPHAAAEASKSCAWTLPTIPASRWLGPEQTTSHVNTTTLTARRMGRIYNFKYLVPTQLENVASVNTFTIGIKDTHLIKIAEFCGGFFHS